MYAVVEVSSHSVVMGNRARAHLVKRLLTDEDATWLRAFYYTVAGGVSEAITGTAMELRSPQFAKSWGFWAPLSIAGVVAIVLGATGVSLEWFWLVIYGGVFIAISPFAKDALTFFRGGLREDSRTNYSFILLSGSAFITWVFAKSILNASVLGASFGIVGGVGYSGWYTSFLSSAVVIYVIRGRGYRSLPEAVHRHYGPLAALSFGLAVLYRLFQEFWSNSLVVAGFYGESGSAEWWLAALVSTAIPVAYVFLGGLRSSLTSDLIQATSAIALLIGVLSVIGSKAPTNLWTWNPAGSCRLPDVVIGIDNPEACAVAGFDGQFSTFTPASCSIPSVATETLCGSPEVGGVWSGPTCALETQPACKFAGGEWLPRARGSLEGGCDLVAVAVLQGMLSYPFFDPVLTDRAFLADRRIMIKAFAFGGTVAGAFIVLFSFMGIYGNAVAILEPDTVSEGMLTALMKGEPAAVSRHISTAMFQIVNIIFITSSISTIDSTCSSVAKLVGLEMLGFVKEGAPRAPTAAERVHVWAGRVGMVVLAVVGTLPLLADPKALNATTVSGTMVMGLGPPILGLMFIKGYQPLVFHLSFWSGAAFGIVYQLATHDCCRDSMDISSWAIGEGKYALLLGVNVVGTVSCFGLAGIAYLEGFLRRRHQPVSGEEELEAVTLDSSMKIGGAEPVPEKE